MSDPLVANERDCPEIEERRGHWGGWYRILTPGMRAAGGSLGVNRVRVPAFSATVPFHWHLREDEVFYVLSGRGVLRYGDALREIGPGDCIACPAGTKVAHQIANPFAEDLEYLAMGPYDRHEVCGYPDNGKTLVRGVGTVGTLQAQPYMAGEPDVPRILDLCAANNLGSSRTS
jgi:uncharacterized cupin superfamily protein